MSAGAPIVSGMQYLDAYPVVFVRDLPATAQFYTGVLGLETLFESDFFVLLALPGTNVVRPHSSAKIIRPRRRAVLRSYRDRACS